MKIAVVTATYNREKMLPILFQSLVKNYETFQDFEWIVQDDGSTDQTKKLINRFKKEVSFPIIYHFQENAGKMRAINEAMRYVTGDIVLEVDSDDYLLDQALFKIHEDYMSLKSENIYGILYKRKLIGKDTTMNKELSNQVVSLFDLHNKYGYDFDMNLTFKAEIRKKYSYIVEEGEKFVTEASLYYFLDQLYDGMKFIDEEIVVGEYLSDGYSKNIKNLFKKYPKGYYAFFKSCLSYIKKDTLLKRKFYFIKHYILFSYLTGKSILECMKEAPKYKGFVLLFVIPGYIKSKKF